MRGFHWNIHSLSSESVGGNTTLHTSAHDLRRPRSLSPPTPTIISVPVRKPHRKFPLPIALLATAAAATVIATAWIHGWYPHMRADATAAWAAWATFAVATIAAVFAYRQVTLARQTREEQAQPNVVMYAESTPGHYQFLDVVLKNFGTTPAYEVTVEVTPALRETPDHEGGDIIDVPFPKLTHTLAPRQEIRTKWDYAVDREAYMTKLRAKFDRKELTPQQFQERELVSIHEAVVTYRDSHDKTYVTHSTLDFNQLRGTTRVATYSIHEVADALREQNKLIAKIAGQLANEHDGIWVYTTPADTERQYRAERTEQIKRKIREAQGYHDANVADPDR